MARWKTPPSQEEIALAARRFAAWIEWFLLEYPDRVPSQAELARLMGVDKATLSLIRSKASEGAPREPSFPTLVGASAVIGHPVDYLLTNDPPARHKGHQ